MWLHDKVFELIKIENSIRLLQNEFNNLIQLTDILVE
jgi:hypothetical protein